MCDGNCNSGLVARDVHGRAGTQFAPLSNYSEYPRICMLLPTIFVSISLISSWVYVRRGKSVKRTLLIFSALHIGVAAMIWGSAVIRRALPALAGAGSGTAC